MNLTANGNKRGTLVVTIDQLETALGATLGVNPIRDANAQTKVVGDIASDVWNKLERTASCKQREFHQRRFVCAKWTLIGWTVCFFVGGIYAGITTNEWVLLNVALSMVCSGTIVWSVIEVFKDSEQ